MEQNKRNWQTVINAIIIVAGTVILAYIHFNQF